MTVSVARPGQRTRAFVLAGVAMFFGLGAGVFLALPVRVGVPAAAVSPFQVVADATFLTITPILGAFLVSRRPDNVIGWLFIHMSLWLGADYFADGYVRHAPPTDLTGIIASVGGAVGALAMLALILLLQLFPTGRLPSPRWRPISVVAWVAITTTAATAVFSTVPLTPPIPDLPLPLAADIQGPWIDALVGGLLLLQVAAVLGSVGVLVVRFRRSRGTERQQMKWFAWAASLVGSLLALALLAQPIGPLSGTLWALAISSLVLLPIASTIAILRYRLWDIDRVVSRTVAYAVVTAVLLGVFAIVNLGLQTALSEVTQADTLAIAASTLAVFVLIQPVRRRTQALVDRRFDRARVDADRSAAQFAARLRDEVDLGRIAAETTATIGVALHPAFARVWLRDPGALTGAVRNDSRTAEA